MDFDRAKSACLNRASLGAEQIAARDTGILTHSLTYNSANNRLIIACMAENGYVFKRSSEIEALCVTATR